MDAILPSSQVRPAVALTNELLHGNIFHVEVSAVTPQEPFFREPKSKLERGILQTNMNMTGECFLVGFF